MAKQTYIKKLAKELKLKYGSNVEIHNKIVSVKQINNLIKKVHTTDIIVLILRNMHNMHLFPDDKDILVMWKARLISTRIRDIHVDHIFDEDEDSFCKICLENYKINGSRSCVQCNKSFCVKCQIKIMIQTVFQSLIEESVDDEYNLLTCPYCKYEHFGYMPNFYIFLERFEQRLIDEFGNNVLNENDVEELTTFFETQLDINDFVE